MGQRVDPRHPRTGGTATTPRGGEGEMADPPTPTGEEIRIHPRGTELYEHGGYRSEVPAGTVDYLANSYYIVN